MPTLPAPRFARFTTRNAVIACSALVLGLGVISTVIAADAATETKAATAKSTVSAPAKTEALPVRKNLSPTADQAKASRLVARQLSVLHYNKTPLNDALSVDIWTRYLSDLDGQHVYFLASDITQFKAQRLRLDDELKAGDLDPAFAIFNRYQQRANERFQFVLTSLEKNRKAVLNFAGNERLLNDRKDAPWVTNKAEMNTLWLNRLRSAALSLKLDGKSGDEIIETLTRRYRSQLKALSQNRSEDAFSLFMNSLTETYDPHTSYFSPRSSENFNINMSLQLEGIGAVLQTEDEYTKVVRLVPAGPADKSRQLKPNDKIVAVGEGDKDLVDVIGWRIDEVVELIRGPKGTTVRLQVIPSGSDDGARKIISLVRNTVALEDQAASKKIIEVTRNGEAKRIGVIKLPAFYADFQGQQNGDPDYRSTTRDVRKLIDELKQARVQGLILDLRNNGGGSLSEVNDLIGEFITTGPTVQVRDARGRVETLGDGNPDVGYSGPLVVMTNRLSASAAEIFAGAIQDYGRGLVVGSTSFGKGSVQSIRDLGHGQLKITEAKFYRISGASTQNKGVEPDIHLPEMFNPKEIGESALPHAMPWDTIRPSRYQQLNDWKGKLDALEQSSKLRQAKSPDIRYLNEQIKLLADLKAQNTSSLNEKIRLSEKQAMDERRLAIENRRRAAKKQALLKTWSEAEKQLEAQNPDNDPNFERPEEQALLSEAAEVLIDSQQLSTSAQAMPGNLKRNADSPLVNR
ncbi:MAG: carboxy terminal-processing peptidase [Paraperlucidibaca sp.]